MHTISELVDVIIAAGPRAGEVLEHLVNSVNHFRSCEGISELRQAVTVITGRAAERETVVLTDEENAKLDQLAEHAGRAGIFRDIFAFIKANPELLQLIMLFLK